MEPFTAETDYLTELGPRSSELDPSSAGMSPRGAERALFSPALGFSGRDWFAELHRRRQCWVSSLLLDVPPLPATSGPLRRPAQPDRKPWLSCVRPGDSLSAELRRLRVECHVEPAAGGAVTAADVDRAVLRLESAPKRAELVPGDGGTSLPGDELLSELELEPDGGLLPSRLTLPCPLLPPTDTGPPQLPPLPPPDQLPLRDLQDPLLDESGGLLSDSELAGWESSLVPPPAAPWAPVELPQPELAPLPLPQLLTLTELRGPSGAPEPPAGQLTQPGRAAGPAQEPTPQRHTPSAPQGVRSGADKTSAEHHQAESTPSGAHASKKVTNSLLLVEVSSEVVLSIHERAAAQHRSAESREVTACPTEAVFKAVANAQSVDISETPGRSRPLEPNQSKPSSIEVACLEPAPDRDNRCPPASDGKPVDEKHQRGLAAVPQSTASVDQPKSEREASRPLSSMDVPQAGREDNRQLSSAPVDKSPATGEVDRTPSSVLVHPQNSEISIHELKGKAMPPKITEASITTDHSLAAEADVSGVVVDTETGGCGQRSPVPSQGRPPPVQSASTDSFHRGDVDRSELAAEDHTMPAESASREQQSPLAPNRWYKEGAEQHHSAICTTEERCDQGSSRPISTPSGVSEALASEAVVLHGNDSTRESSRCDASLLGGGDCEDRSGDGEAPSVHRPCSAVSQENGSGDRGVETALGDRECSTWGVSATAGTVSTPPRELKPAVVKEEVPSHRSPPVSHHTTGPRSIFSPSCQLTLDGALASPPLPPSGSEDPLASTVMKTTPVQEDQECGSGKVRKAVGRHGSVTDLPEGGDISDTKRESAAPLSVTVLSEPFSPLTVSKESEPPPSRERLAEVSPDRGEPPTKMFHLSGILTAKVTHLSHETMAQAVLMSSERQVAHVLSCEQPAKVAHLKGEQPTKMACQSDEPPIKVAYLNYETTVKAAHPSSELPTAHGDKTGCSVTAGAQPSATEPAASQLTAADSFLAALSARVQSRAERTPLSARRGLPSALLTSRAGRRVRGGRPRGGPVALSRALSRCGLPEPRRGAAARTPRAVEPPGVGQGAVCGLTQTQRSSDDHAETAVTLDELTLRCLACLVERGDELLQPLRLDVPFALLEPDNSRRLLKEMCCQVNESLSSLERQGLLRQYRHTLAVHGLAKARDMTAHLSVVCGLRQLRIFSRTHADILQGCLDAVIGDLESTLAGRSVRHPRVAALLALLTELHVDSLPGPVLVVTEQFPELTEELSSALTEVPGVRHVLLTADEPQQRLDEALRQRAVLVLSCGGEVPPRWPLSRCALLVPLLPPAAADPLVQRCRASSVAVRCLPVRPDWEALRHPERHVPVSPPPAPPPPGPPPAGQPVSVVACVSAAERWGLRRLEELSGHTVTVHTRDYSRLAGLSAGPFPDLVLAADSCLLVRSLADLASPSDGQRLAVEVRALQQQAALCWLVVVGRRRAAAAADTDTRREEAVVGRLRALLASTAHLPEYTLRLVRADQDSVVHIVLDIVQQTAETAGSAGDGRSDDSQPGADAQCSEDEWRLLQLPACNAVSAGLLLRRAGGLQQLCAAPLGRLVQIMPELPVRILAALQRHLQQPQQTTATPGDFCEAGTTMNDQDITGPSFLPSPRPPSPPTAAFPSDVPRRESTVPSSNRRWPGLHPGVPPFGAECHPRLPYGDESDGDYRPRHHPGYGRRFDRQHGSEHGLEHGDSTADGSDDWLTAPNAVDLLAAEACPDECNPHWLDEDNVYDDSPPMETSQ